MRKHKELVDQSAHFGSCFGLAFVAPFPLLGMIPAVLFAITREYYQTKAKMLKASNEHRDVAEIKFGQVIEFMWDTNAFTKLDLRWSYGGAVAGNIAGYFVWRLLWQ